MWDWIEQYILRFFGPEFWIAVVALAVAVPLLWRDYLTRGGPERDRRARRK